MRKEDLEKIANDLEFDVEDVEMLIGVFLQSAQESLPELLKAIENVDFEQIASLSHAIKGSSANIRLVNISEIAAEIEQAAKGKSVFNYEEKYKILEGLIFSLEES